ncbi:uncharacterized protein LOC132167054 [Corylus avellana]|uniref:uncharacterized protein LOC132167054 n=1 Tax=Corylus avellana TaxID=13451 RepID=UPI00286CE550|nr:uncharacterized protein LOC132167054 [Corylus avellana]
MSILSWNCRGLGNLWIVRDICRLVKEKKPNLVFLMETKLMASRVERVKYKLGFSSVFVVDCVGRSGGLALFWNDNELVEIQNYSRRHINAKISGVDGIAQWILTGFYGHPEVAKRKESWDLLMHLHSLTSSAWMCVGDFNEILADEEKYGANKRPRWQIRDFQQTMERCQLHDLGFLGPKFTWSNKREDGHFIMERLDRAIANQAWMTSYPNYGVEVLANHTSDHAPINVQLCIVRRDQWRLEKKFFYAAGWGKKDSHNNLIKSVWREKGLASNPWMSFSAKIGRCKKVITRWQIKEKGQAESQIQQKTEQLKLLQMGDSRPEEEKIKLLQQEVNDIFEKEEMHWRQRAKEHWLKSGDKNTKFFHASVNQRRRMNHIVLIEDKAGNLCTTPESINRAFTDYFQNIFSTSNPYGLRECLHGLERRITPSMNEQLEREITVEEIYYAISQMGVQKAPGPDGLPACFYHDNWSIIGEETMANRLKVLLHEIISPNQSVFIPGRLISDNVLAAYETMHSMHSRMWGKVGYMALKLDMSKAYNRLEWCFVEEPDSLASKILKAKYFPKSSLREAKVTSRPSLAWRSILSAKELFFAGLNWRIGNVRDFKGQVCAATCLVQEGSLEPTVAEAMGALNALEFCRDLGFQEIVLEGDSKTVVQAIKG